MSFDLTLAACAAGIGYFLGALPFGYLIAKANGVDIFTVGSKNPGATNVKRCVGPKAGNQVFALDFVKGLLATGWPLFFANAQDGYKVALVGLAAAVIGHSFSCFTRFRGGKGVATMLGGVAALMPWAALVGVIVWTIAFYTSRYVSLASILLAFSLPVTNFLTGAPVALFWVSVVLAIIVIYRHKSNIGRLLKGEENRFERKGSKTESNASAQEEAEKIG